MSIKGYSTELKAVKSGKVQNSERFATISGVGYRKYASDVSPKSYYELTPTIQTAGSYDAITGELTLVGHTARPGDLIRVMDVGVYNRFELEVLAVDGDKIIIDPRVLDGQVIATFKILRAVSNLTGPDGEVSVSSSSPVRFVRNDLQENVTENTVDPSLNAPLPTKMFIQKDGEILPVNKDTGVPDNTVAVPVEIVGVSGTEINITAGDINVQSTSEGANFDSIRLGDGSGVYLKIETDGSINATVDQSVAEGKLDSIESVLDLINGKDFATETKLEAVRLLIASLDGKDFATETTLDAVSTKLDSLATSAGQSDIVDAIQNIVFDKTGLATAAKQDEAFLKLSEMDLALDNGNVLLTSIDGKATTTNTALGTANTKLTEIDNAVDAISAKLPASLGAKTKALSLSITPATDSGLATEAKQDSGIAELTAIKNSVSAATFIPKTYDEVALTYNGEGDIGTVIYKLASTTIATLTLGYTNGNLTSVVKS